jgi:hypothetical protein
MHYWEKIGEERQSTMRALRSPNPRAGAKETLWLHGPSGSILTADHLIQSVRDIQIHRQRMKRFSYFVALLICLCLYASALVVVFMSIGPWLKPSNPLNGVCLLQGSKPVLYATDCSRIQRAPRT